MSSVGKITIMVDQTRMGEVIKVRTTGKRGTVLLNTVSNDTGYGSQTASPDAPTFWHGILTRASTQF